MSPELLNALLYVAIGLLSHHWNVAGIADLLRRFLPSSAPAPAPAPSPVAPVVVPVTPAVDPLAPLAPVLDAFAQRLEARLNDLLAKLAPK